MIAFKCLLFFGRELLELSLVESVQFLNDFTFLMVIITLVLSLKADISAAEVTDGCSLMELSPRLKSLIYLSPFSGII